MLTNNKCVAIPTQVLQNYTKFITDKEFLALLHLAGVENNGKTSFETAAKMMGYETIGPFQTLLNSMVKKGAIVVEKYKVDVSPLWSWCVGEITPVNQPTPSKKDNSHYVIASIVNDASNTTNKHAVAGIVKRLLIYNTQEEIIRAYSILPTVRKYVAATTKEEDLINTLIKLAKTINEEEIVNYIKYSYEKAMAKNATWVPTHYNLINWLQIWVDKGKPTGATNQATVEELLGA